MSKRTHSRTLRANARRRTQISFPPTGETMTRANKSEMLKDGMSPDELAETLRELEPVFATIETVMEEPCSECGSTGDTLPCVECDKLVCGERGVECRWCKDHAPVIAARAGESNDET